MQCAEYLRAQAYFDLELDAASSYEVEQHLGHCAECSGFLNDSRTLRGALRRDIQLERAPADVRNRVLEALDQEPTTRPRTNALRFVWPPIPQFLAGLFSGLGFAAAAVAAWLLIGPMSSSRLIDDLVSAHVHALLPGHLVAVVSNDRHTVKPWFAGNADVSPAVADFDAQGYKLIGGRVDYIEGQRAAIVVYQHGAHMINVFTWASNNRPLSTRTTRNGYHFDFWKVGNLQYCAVSDTGWDELQNLMHLLSDLAISEAHPVSE